MFLVGIAGGSGSGKTTFAKKVQKNIPDNKIAILHMDSYYCDQLIKNPEEKKKANFDHPNAFDWDLLREHIQTLKSGGEIEVPCYDFTISRRLAETTKLGPCDIILFEGIFSLFDLEIRKLLDIKCFLHVESDIRFTRRMHRDVNERGRSIDSVIEQYYATVRPMYQKFLDPQKQYADFTVGEETDVASHILSARIKEVIIKNNEVQEELLH